MPHAKLRLTVPEGVWIGDLSRSYPEATIRILSALPGEERGVGLVEISAPDLVSILQEMEEMPEVSEFELLQRTDDSVLARFETSEPLLLAPMQGSGVPVEMPFDIVDGEAEWEATASQDRLSELGDQLEAFGIEFTVEYIHQHLTSERLLTERQRTLIETAVERGYYDTPRECSLTDLAEAVGIAKSTCSETLHRAESKIITQFVSEDPIDRTVETTR